MRPNSSVQVSDSQLTLQVTVLRAHNLPRLKSPLGKKRQFYATVTYGEITWRTRSVRSVAQRVEWNEDVRFAVQPLSRITISLYAERTTQKDILVGRQEIACEPQGGLDIVFSGADGCPSHTTEPTTLSLTVTMSANSSSFPTASAKTSNPTTVDFDDPVAEGNAGRPAVQSNNEATQSTAVAAAHSPSSQPSDIPIERDTRVGPVTDSQTDMSRTLDSAEGAMDTMKSWKSAVDVVKTVMDHVGPIITMLPYAKPAWELLSKIPETLQHQFQRDDNVQTLLKAIRDAFEIAKEADVLRNMEPASAQAKILDEMLACVSECAKFIISYANDVQVAKRTLKNTVGGVDEKIGQFRSNLFRLRDNFLARAAVITEVAVLDVLDAEMGTIIRDLPYKGGWRFGDEKRCLEGTREEFLDFIIKWVENSESKRGLVLLGQAGTGKSSIAHEIARRFDGDCLGSYFTFLRKEGSKADAYQLFTTLARDLSDRHRAFKRALGTVVKDNSSLRRSRDYRTLFDRLLVEPLEDLQVPLPGPILIVIDALDESEDAIGKVGLHSFLSQRLVDLPSYFRVLVTSRPENGVEPMFAKASSVDILYMNDDQLSSNTEQDIGLYLEKELPPEVFKEHGVKLAEAAEGLFQWATVASGFINGPASLGVSMKTRVERILGRSRGRTGEGLLYAVYEEVLKVYFQTDEAQMLFRTIMGQLVAAVKPLSIESLIALRQHLSISDLENSDPDLVPEILGHLGSLLSNVTSPDRTRPIIPLHTSFRDFLTNKTSNVFYVDLVDAHHQLAHSCVSSMLDGLEFNICKLESSYLANSDVADLDSRINKYIPPCLSYACVFWGDHLTHIPFGHDLFTKLELLVETKFLFWLEVLSVTSNVRLASPTLLSLSKWLQQERSQVEVKNVLGLVNDGSAFVRYFGMAVAKSAPHIYVSALPFTPHSSRILNQYLRQFPRTLTLERGQLSHWPALEMTINAFYHTVHSIAFSPDGQRIASPSYDRICVWDATTGESIAGRLTGYTPNLSCVALSSDGRLIASAWYTDHVIRVRDASTGEVIAGPFTGHTSLIHSVAFSPDGNRIASASIDYTIRLWDPTTGEAVADPFTGHTDAVKSVAFSPDGHRIASGSDDRMVRLWDIATGNTVAGLFTGHTAAINSVAFSPDGNRIASASHDCTIRVWNSATGEVVAGPYTGHTDRILSVAFSPDGHRIASASEDCTIRVWDAVAGEVVAGPFIGHTDSITSVAFSPDGHRVASASVDRTIRVWDVSTGEALTSPLTGRTSGVVYASFLPDGQCVASASEDHTIHILDAATGEVVAGPFTGHSSESRILSVAFSSARRRIASASSDHTIRVWDAATGEVAAGSFTGDTDLVGPVVFSPDGDRIASASLDHKILVLDAATGEVASTLTGHTGGIHSVAFLPDGQRIVSASYNYTMIKVWDAATGEVVVGPSGRPSLMANSIQFSPDWHRIASISENSMIQVWDVATGQVVGGPFAGQTDPVKLVVFSPDGHRLASASWDNTIRVWDAVTGEVVAGPLTGVTGHTGLVTSVAFSPDGRRITSASMDCTIRVWDAATGEVLAGPFSGHTDSSSLSPSLSFSMLKGSITTVAFLSDGQHIVSSSDDGNIRVEKVTAGDIDEINPLTGQSWINGNGWICGKDGGLLLWIPVLHRALLHRPSTVWATGPTRRSVETRLDFSNFVHGSNWATVHDHTLSCQILHSC